MFSQLASASHEGGKERSWLGSVVYSGVCFPSLEGSGATFPYRLTTGETWGLGCSSSPNHAKSPENNPLTLGHKRTLRHERPSLGGLLKLTSRRHSRTSCLWLFVCKFRTSRSLGCVVESLSQDILGPRPWICQETVWL